jgi:hypothetical protein
VTARRYSSADLIGRFLRSRTVRRGQVLVLAVVIFFLFFAVAVVLIDVYSLFEARNWGYRVAQQAALAGVSGSSTKWVVAQPTATPDPYLETPTPGAPDCIDPIMIELDAVEAYDDALAAMEAGMQTRGYSPGDYAYDIQVLPNYDGSGGIPIPGFPPTPVRLGGSRGEWGSENPAVGVYIYFHVDTFLLESIGITSPGISVFASAEVSQPPACP